MKKAQTNELIVMIILLLVFVLFTLFTSLSTSQTTTESNDRIAHHASKINSELATITPSLITYEKLPIANLLSYSACYSTETADYKALQLDIEKAVQETIDPYYGKGNWQLELKYNQRIICYSPNFKEEECKKPAEGKIEANLFLIPASCSFDFIEGTIYVKY